MPFHHRRRRRFKRGRFPTSLPRFVLVGNPNVGKSVIFNLLTRRYASVSNYPGTTVELMTGSTTLNHQPALIVDTPGVNSLIPMSEEEMVTRNILMFEDPRGIILVIDSKNLSRGLLIALQLAEMGLPFLIDLNMEDEAKSLGMKVDVNMLSELMGVKVVPTVSTQRKGIKDLIDLIPQSSQAAYPISYRPDIEEGIAKLTPLIKSSPINKRAIALMLLAGDRSLIPWLSSTRRRETIEQIDQIRSRIEAKFHQPLSSLINQQLLQIADEIIQKVQKERGREKRNWQEVVGRLSLHPLWGIPILLLVLFLVYQFVGKFGAGTTATFMENVVFGKYINPWVTEGVKSILPVKFLQELIVGQYGLMTMALTYSFAIILPIVAYFFLAFALLEDSGYLPRLAAMLNSPFKIIGLTGKAVLPLMLGLGCCTMATLSARILDSRKERILVTLLLALSIPCSAQMAVILALLAGISLKATLWWGGTILAVLIGTSFASSRLLPGASSDFIMELPPIRRPQLSNILLKTSSRIMWYLREAVPLFILGTLVLFVLDKFDVLSYLEKLASPVITQFLDLPSRATQAFIVGFLRRDYGVAGLYLLAKQGQLSGTQIVVGVTTLTLFVPCIANLFVMLKERGWKVTSLMLAFIIPVSLLIGGLLNFILRTFGVQF
ncbi:ferrous iron transport protein B [bacterium (candidate division B38) B3_B38]|nr:MAG: ferrous iron transport protein B [bacterium (candidate division B38) B3_B38]